MQTIQEKKSQSTIHKNSTSQAPTNIPHIWGTSELMWLAWDGAVPSALGRNWGQSTV